MTDGEWEDFWALLEARRAANPSQRAPSQILPPRSPGHLIRHQEGEWGGTDSGSRMRPHKTHHRCGTCKGCTSSDCGTCKNCKDKPRFGGPGIKKKACLRRICLKSRRDMGDETDDEAQQEEDAATSPEQLATPGDQPPPTALNHENSSSIGSSQTHSEVTSPAMRPCSPSNDSTSQQGEGTCERPPLEELSEPQHSQLDVLSRMAMHAMQAR